MVFDYLFLTLALTVMKMDQKKRRTSVRLKIESNALHFLAIKFVCITHMTICGNVKFRFKFFHSLPIITLGHCHIRIRIRERINRERSKTQVTCSKLIGLQWKCYYCCNVLNKRWLNAEHCDEQKSSCNCVLFSCNGQKYPEEFACQRKRERAVS